MSGDMLRLLTRRPSREVRVALYSATLIAAATPLVVPLAGTDFAGSTELPWWSLLLLFAGAEVFVLHVQVRREAQTVSLSEIPLVLGLFFASPIAFIVARVLGPVLVLAIHRRQAPIKLLFNSALLFAEAALAVTLFRAVAGSSVELAPAGWLGAYLAAGVAGGVFVSIATMGVISLYEGRPMLRMFLSTTRFTIPLSLVVATFGLIGAHALGSEPVRWWMLVVAFLTLFVGYRTHAQLRDRHLALERLYTFSQVVTSTPDVDDILRDVLTQAREMLRAERSELVLFAPDGGTDVRLHLLPDDRVEQLPSADDDDVLRSVFASGSATLLSRATREPAERAYLTERGMREAIVAPLPGETHALGALVVADRLGDVRGFDGGDTRLLETVANQASVALRKGQLIDRLRHDALHDSLTELPNRVHLQHRIKEELGRVTAGDSAGVAVMILDLNGFKEVNDTLGHQHGDLLLREIASRLRSLAEEESFVGRLGGDEFAMVFADGNVHARALAAGRRLQAELMRPIVLDGVEVEVDAAMGIALAPGHARTMPDMLKRADVAMYRAKQTGEIELYDPEYDGADRARLALVPELRQAVEQGELRLFVQPQIALDDGRVVGVESLVRWQHPTKGLLAPAAFIDVAERSALIRPMTEWVLRQSLAAQQEWTDAGLEIGVSINLSPRALADTAFCERMVAQYRRSGLPRNGVTFEITENVLLEDPERAITALEGIRRAGVRISIDDFGTGYSSLAYLKRLPVDEVKIDRSFVSALLADAGDAAIVRAVADLGRGLGLTVVAEGVEGEEIAELVTRYGCVVAQGFHYAAPMPVAQFESWLAGYDAGRAAHPYPGPHLALARVAE